MKCNILNALSADDVISFLNFGGSECAVLINGKSNYEISYSYNNGNPIINIRNKDNEGI